MASIVREQAREIGIRMALGAEPERLRREVLQRALTVAGSGVAVGLVIALAEARVMQKLLYEVSPTDPIALLTACAVLLGVVLIAAYVPARWATKVDPASALRAE
jgi:ABC-type antimicrobial peptide transport system permease subunit